MNTKKFMACMYLKNEVAYQDREGTCRIEETPVALAESYSENECDAIYVGLLSENDAEHEKDLDVLREICQNTAVPVIGSGHIFRMEDVKKLLYAGCQQVMLDYADPVQLELTKEVSLKFGKEKIAVGVADISLLEQEKELLKEYTSNVFLFCPGATAEAALMSPVPVVTFLPEVSLEKLIEVLSYANISGISGKLVNENITEISAIKALCRENKIPVEDRGAAYAFSDLKKGPDGLVPVVVQDVKTDAVLMVAYMNEEAYNQTLRTGRMTYYSRSRSELWLKGETSGHYQYVHSLTADCDLDTILAKVTQVGAACHTGSYSCFFNEIQNRSSKQEAHNPMKVFEEVFSVIEDRKEHPKEGSYTNYLFDKGIDKILKKVGEEATEIVIAAKNPNPNEIKYEIADFLYHMMVLMAEKGVTWEEVTTELANR